MSRSTSYTEVDLDKNGGALSALVFAWVHQVTISNIWFMVGPMLVAGALSGLCIAWSFDRVFVNRSVSTWIAYNGPFLLVFGVLAAASVLVLEPVTTLAEVTSVGGPVHHLIVPALPVTGTVTIAATVAIGRVVAHRRSDYMRILSTSVVLMVLVGLNISVLGLVDFGGASVTPVLRFLGLVALLAAVFAGVYLALRWSELSGVPGTPDGSTSQPQLESRDLAGWHT